MRIKLSPHCHCGWLTVMDRTRFKFQTKWSRSFHAFLEKSTAWTIIGRSLNAHDMKLMCRNEPGLLNIDLWLSQNAAFVDYQHVFSAEYNVKIGGKMSFITHPRTIHFKRLCLTQLHLYDLLSYILQQLVWYSSRSKTDRFTALVSETRKTTIRTCHWYWNVAL